MIDVGLTCAFLERGLLELSFLAPLTEDASAANMICIPTRRGFNRAKAESAFFIG